MNDYVLIQRIEEKPKGVIVAPDVAKEKGIKGKVLAVGPGKWVEGINGDCLVRRKPEVKPGDVVYFNSKWNDFAGDHYTTSSYVEARTNAERDKIHLVQEADIFAIQNKEFITHKMLTKEAYEYLTGDSLGSPKCLKR